MPSRPAADPQRPPDSPPRRWAAGIAPRGAPVLAAAAILLAGLAVRAATDGAVAKYAGVALYAGLSYALVLCVAPRLAPAVAAAISLGWCWAVELAQLTPAPAALSARSALARLVLGSTFNPPDLVWYTIGVAGAVAVHRLSRRLSPPAGPDLP